MKKSLLYFEFTLVTVILASFIYLFAHFENASLREDIPLSSKEYPIIIIDAGHGGLDGGTSSKSGILEKDLNLKYSLLIADYLNSFGFDTVLTRDDDYMLTDGSASSKKRQDLNNRVKIAEEYSNAIFISVHMNSYPLESCEGLQVYYSKNDESSQMLAAYIQSFTHNFLQPQNQRNIKQATSAIYILDKIQIPSVLIECGFLSNEAEAKMLSSDEYAKKLSLIIASAVEEYLFSEINA